jgi:ArsR family transcriptional regulator, virulence genes transcriptional regulator
MMDSEQMNAHAGQAAALLKILANENRLKILCALIDREMSVGELYERLDLSQSALSQHLAKLREQEIVKTRRVAQTIYYSLHSKSASHIIRVLHKLYCQ